MLATELDHDLTDRFNGPLFEGCTVVIEDTVGREIALASIEGYTADD